MQMQKQMQMQMHCPSTPLPPITLRVMGARLRSGRGDRVL
ncbi:MAG: hypothetical protein JWN45_1759 [Acidobacteriaceae bacterium]|nr:hypothetical protein [Acidobacteriaceae bacterium]